MLPQCTTFKAKESDDMLSTVQMKSFFIVRTLDHFHKNEAEEIIFAVYEELGIKANFFVILLKLSNHFEVVFFSPENYLRIHNSYA